MSRDDEISRRDVLRGRFMGDRRRIETAPTAGTRVAGPTIHRPPGAVEEEAFLAGCTRCGECIKACPVDAIVLAGPKYGRAAGTPIIEAMRSPCVMCQDTPCISACEPGVLRRDVPLKMGTASIRTPNCLAHQGTLCTVCSERCPVDGALESVDGKPLIHDEICTGCGVCQYVCPAPYNAVLILPAERGAFAPPPQTSSFDWRRAYLGDRTQRPPQSGATRSTRQSSQDIGSPSSRPLPSVDCTVDRSGVDCRRTNDAGANAMNDVEVLEAACCLAATDSDVTVEELQLLSALVGRVGIERKRFETLMEKAGNDPSFREQRIGAVSGDIEGAMDKLMRIAFQGGSTSEGHAAMLLWRVAAKLQVSPERFEALLAAARSTD
ncbi:MAG: 4Fe-4S dicluster domain-containing protein [Planctomycetota bacterium]|jgi:MauM/NapG family ferredoxin protein